MQAKIGDEIKILGLAKDSNGKPDPAEKDYIGKSGFVEYIDGKYNLHGTWGSLAILPVDEYEILENAK